MPIDVFASEGPLARLGGIFTVGQHVVVKWKAGARVAGIVGLAGPAGPAGRAGPLGPGEPFGDTMPMPGVAHGSVTKIDGVSVGVSIDEGVCRGFLLYIDALGVLANNDLNVLTWLLERSSLVPAESNIPADLARQGLIPKSFNDTLDRIFGAVKKARLHDHTLRNPTATDINPSELLIAVDLVRRDLTIHPDAWVFSQGNGRFDVHIEPGLYYTFYT